MFDPKYRQPASQITVQFKNIKIQSRISKCGRAPRPRLVYSDVTRSCQNCRYSSVKSDIVSRRETAFATGLKIQF